MLKVGHRLHQVCGVCTGVDRKEAKNGQVDRFTGKPKVYYTVSLAIGNRIWGIGVQNDDEYNIFQPGGVYEIVGNTIYGQAEATGGTDNFGKPKAKMTQLTLGGLLSVKQQNNGTLSNELLPPKQQAENAAEQPSREEVNAAYTGGGAAPPKRRAGIFGGTQAAA